MKRKLGALLSLALCLAVALSVTVMGVPALAAAPSGTADAVYLDAAGGSDANTGAGESDAVQTLDRALELAAADGTIYLCTP